MPFYEYTCETCAHDFEELVGMSAPNPPCPECAGEAKRTIARSFAIGKPAPKGPVARPCGGCPTPGVGGCPLPQ